MHGTEWGGKTGVAGGQGAFEDSIGILTYYYKQ